MDSHAAALEAYPYSQPDTVAFVIAEKQRAAFVAGAEWAHSAASRIELPAPAMCTCGNPVTY